jgi:transposase InsO family protein
LTPEEKDALILALLDRIAALEAKLGEPPKTPDNSSLPPGPWRSFEAVEFATLEWVDWFNNRRLLEPIGNLPPAEAEAAYYAQLELARVAA